jgi:hypothetical protein
LVVKSIAEHVLNTSTFERSVLGGVCTVICGNGGDGILCDGLVGKSSPLTGYPHVAIADKIRFHGLLVGLGDIVLWRDAVGFVVGCAREEDGFFVFVDTLSVTAEPISPQTRVCRPDGQRMVWPVPGLRLAMAWYLREGGDWVVLCA